MRKLLLMSMLCCSAFSLKSQWEEYSPDPHELRRLHNLFGSSNISFSYSEPACLTIRYPDATVEFDSAHTVEVKENYLFLLSKGGSTVVFDVAGKKELLRKPFRVFSVSPYGDDCLYMYFPSERVTAVATESKGILYQGEDNVKLFNHHYVRSTHRYLSDGSGMFNYLTVACDGFEKDSIDLPRGSVETFGGLLFITNSREKKQYCYTAELDEIFVAEPVFETRRRQTKISGSMLFVLETAGGFHLNTANIPTFSQPFTPLTPQEAKAVTYRYNNAYSIVLDKAGNILFEWPGDIRVNEQFTEKDVLTVYDNNRRKLLVELTPDGSYREIGEE